MKMNNEVSNNPIFEPSNSLINFMKLLLSTSFSPKQETDNNYLNKIVHNNKMSLFESLKFKNFCSVGEKTRIIINGNNNNIGTIVEGDYYNMNLNIDMDWLMRFYDSVGCTSNDVLQNLWAKILAGEINHPNSCSLRTLDILKNVTEKEARSFEKVCKFIAHCGENDHFIFDVGFLSNYGDKNTCKKYVDDYSLNYENDIVPLEECGLISNDRQLALDYSKERENNICEINTDEYAFLLDYTDEVKSRLSNKSEDKVLFNETVYFLTGCGVEVYNAISKMPNFKAEIGYVIACLFYYNKKYNNFKFSIHKKIDENSLSADLLSEVKKNMKQFLPEIDVNDEIALIKFILSIPDVKEWTK